MWLVCDDRFKFSMIPWKTDRGEHGDPCHSVEILIEKDVYEKYGISEWLEEIAHIDDDVVAVLGIDELGRLIVEHSDTPDKEGG